MVFARRWPLLVLISEATLSATALNTRSWRRVSKDFWVGGEGGPTFDPDMKVW